MDISEVLLKAAQRIEYKGWVQHAYQDEYGRVCASTAINQTVWAEYSDNAAALALVNQSKDAVLKHLNARKPKGAEPYYSIPGWNDRFERTQEDVLATLRAVAEEQK